MYITRLAANELITLPTINFIYLTVCFIIALTTFYILNKNLNSGIYDVTKETLTSFIILYSKTTITLVRISIIYLLLTLVVAVKTANKKEAPIKSILK